MKIESANRLKTSSEYYFSKKLREIAQMNESGEPVINLGIGSPDQSPPKEVIETLVSQALVSSNHSYQSYKGILEFRAAIAEHYQSKYRVTIDPSTDLLPLIGSKEGIMHVSMAFLNPGDTVLVPNPGYPTYSAVAKLLEANIVEYDLLSENNWMPDLNRLTPAILDQAKIMWINYPNMPTGQFPDEKVLKSLIDLAKKHQFLIINDNPYAQILFDESFSIFQLDPEKSVTMELFSLSKTFNMAGWRLGSLAGNEHYINQVLQVKSNMDSGMFKPLQLAACKALAISEEWYDELNKTYQSRKGKVVEILEMIDCAVDNNQGGMFVWAKIPEHAINAYDFIDDILQGARVFITPGGIFGSNGDRYVRISLCSPIEVFVKAKQKIESHLKLLKS